MTVYLINRRSRRGRYRDDGTYVVPEDDDTFLPVEYEVAGNTYVLPPNSRTEVPSLEHAQVALGRVQTLGVTLETE